MPACFRLPSARFFHGQSVVSARVVATNASKTREILSRVPVELGCFTWLILEVSIGQAGAFGCSASALELSGLSCLRFAFRPGKLLARKEQIFKETATMWKR